MLAFTLRRIEPEEENLHIMINMYQEDVSMELPTLSERNWHLAVGTDQSITKDIIDPMLQQAVTA